MRLRGKGVPTLRAARGDQLVQLFVEVPSRSPVAARAPAGVRAGVGAEVSPARSASSTSCAICSGSCAPLRRPRWPSPPAARCRARGGTTARSAAYAAAVEGPPPTRTAPRRARGVPARLADGALADAAALELARTSRRTATSTPPSRCWAARSAASRAATARRGAPAPRAPRAPARPPDAARRAASALRLARIPATAAASCACSPSAAADWTRGACSGSRSCARRRRGRRRRPRCARSRWSWRISTPPGSPRSRASSPRRRERALARAAPS